MATRKPAADALPKPVILHDDTIQEYREFIIKKAQEALQVRWRALSLGLSRSLAST
jgi:hypothetical protein